MEFKKNQIVELYIDDIGNEGEGIGHIDGYALFLKDAVIGDKVRAKIIKTKKNYGFARVEEVIEASKDRVSPRCSKARQCGGCTLQHLAYEKQLEYKFNKVKNCLERIGGLENIEEKMEPILSNNRSATACGRTTSISSRNDANVSMLFCGIQSNTPSLNITRRSSLSIFLRQKGILL